MLRKIVRVLKRFWGDDAISHTMLKLTSNTNDGTNGGASWSVFPLLCIWNYVKRPKIASSSVVMIIIIITTGDSCVTQ